MADIPVVSDSAASIAPVPKISIQSFSESDDVSRIIDEAGRDRRLGKAHIKTHMGGIAAAIEAFRTAPTPNLVVLETRSNRGLLFDQLDALAEFCDAGTKVMVIGYENDIALYRELISRGVSDYVVAPIDPLAFVSHVSALYNAAGADALGRVIAVFGAKGGVGASTIAHNLGWSISTQLALQTVIVDMDLAFGTVGLDFNQDPQQGIAEAIYSPERLDANFIDRLMSKCSDTLSILAAPATADQTYDFQEKDFDGVVEVLRASTPCAILDVPHQWCGWTKRALVNADEVVIVATPDLGNLRNAKMLIEAVQMERMNDHAPRVVINMAGVPRRPEIPVGEFAKAVEIDPACIIPFEPKLFGAATNNGQMLAEIDSSSKIIESLDELSRLLMRRAGTRRNKTTRLGPLMRRLASLKAS